MNFEYIGQALGYHGQPLQKIWDDERGVEDLRVMGLTQVNYAVYQERQKFFTFQERAKRLKMHQFLARKATDLYDRGMVANVMEDSVLAQGNTYIAQMPPFEFFLNVKDKRKTWPHRLDALKQGDIIYTQVTRLVNGNRLVVKPLCTAEPKHAYLADIPIKAMILQDYWGPLPLDKQGNPRNFSISDFLRCEISSISADTERLTLNMIGMLNKSPDLKFGLCDLNELPKYYRDIHNLEHPSVLHYEDELNKALEFANPNYDMLFQLNGLQPNENLTLMSNLKTGFPESETASELRQKQASQWAFRSVADGIEHFKNGQHVEAFQCLNKALNIDPRNVEGLVARGALYANCGSFRKGLQDFEKALNLNKYHFNARQYMGETLVALGRSYEEENRIPEAVKAYSDCLNLLPQHEQARQSLDALQRSGDGKQRLSSDLIRPTGGQSSDESTSSSNSESESEEQAGKAKTNINQPFYSQNQNKPPGKEKLDVIDAQKANEFRLDDDETVTSVRKLLREASKHKKAKKKGKKKKDKKEGRRSKSVVEDPIDLLKKIDFQEAFRLMKSTSSEAELKAKIRDYLNDKEKGKGDSPPPPPPMRKTAAPSKKSNYDTMGPSTSRHAAAVSATGGDHPPVSKYHEQKKPPEPGPKLSFQIKKLPLQMDKLGMLRLAEPLKEGRSSSSRSRSISRSRSRSRYRRRGRSPRSRHGSRRGDSRSGSKSRSRSRSQSRRRRTFSRSRSSSPRRYGNRFVVRRYANRRDRRSRSFHRRRTPSPFVPRRSPFVPRRSPFGHRRSPSPFVNRRSPSPFKKRRTPSPFVPRRTPSPATRYRRTRSKSRARRTRSRSPSRSRTRSQSPRHFQSRFPPRGRGRGRGVVNRNKYSWYNHDARSVSRALEPNGKEEKNHSATQQGKIGANEGVDGKAVTGAEFTTGGEGV
ncbi:tetratricopeptide repeat protein 14 homolog isoform X2 [Drosophila eugracilis]|uniref:tetratricopeptide repeat protein 14 homolog isoform X2 n=1 Tax=Drosophila eugracilis TaxID=29029 RepID=UPI0007E61E2D|nr:tetratricopeptide repeat protein 14 homolog isoform X2 [Drosophila eugracilis]